MKIVKFESNECVACKTMKPFWDRAVKENPNVTFEIVNVSNTPETACVHRINSLPTIVCFTDYYTELERFCGTMTSVAIADMIKRNKE